MTMESTPESIFNNQNHSHRITCSSGMQKSNEISPPAGHHGVSRSVKRGFKPKSKPRSNRSLFQSTFSSVLNTGDRPYRTFSHYGFVMPLDRSMPKHYHYPTTKTTFQPLKRLYSIDEMFSSAWYIPYPDYMVAKLLKYKKSLQQRFRSNHTCPNMGAAAHVVVATKRNSLHDLGVKEMDDALNGRIVQGILSEIIEKAFTWSAQAGDDSQSYHTASVASPDTACIPLPLPPNKVLPRDVRFQRQSEFMQMWKRAEPAEAAPSYSSTSVNSYAFLSDCEQQVICEIDKSHLADEEEIFAKIRDSMLNRTKRSTIDSDDSSSEEQETEQSFDTFVTSTPTEKGTPINQFTTRLILRTRAKPCDMAGASSNSGGDVPNITRPKVNVKMNINKIRVVKSVESVAGRPKKRNFILENIHNVKDNAKRRLVNSSAEPSLKTPDIKPVTAKPFVRSDSARGYKGWISLSPRS